MNSRQAERARDSLPARPTPSLLDTTTARPGRRRPSGSAPPGTRPCSPTPRARHRQARPVPVTPAPSARLSTTSTAMSPATSQASTAGDPRPRRRHLPTPARPTVAHFKVLTRSAEKTITEDPEPRRQYRQLQEFVASPDHGRQPRPSRPRDNPNVLLQTRETQPKPSTTPSPTQLVGRTPNVNHRHSTAISQLARHYPLRTTPRQHGPPTVRPGATTTRRSQPDRRYQHLQRILKPNQARTSSNTPPPPSKAPTRSPTAAHNRQAARAPTPRKHGRDLQPAPTCAGVER